MPTHADLLAAKGREHADRFEAHSKTAGMLFFRDIINKEAMAREAFEADPPVGYHPEYLWKQVTGRKEETEALSRDARNWRLPYPWTSARVDRSEVDGLNHGSGVKTFANIRDTWYNVMHRDATALSRFHRDRADRPPSRGHMPRYLDPNGQPLSALESARVRAELEGHRTRVLRGGGGATSRTTASRGSGASRHTRRSRPRSAVLSSRSALSSSRRGPGARTRDNDRTGALPPTARSAVHAKHAVERAVRQKRQQRKLGRGGASARSLDSRASTNTWLALGHTSRSRRMRK